MLLKTFVYLTLNIASCILQLLITLLIILNPIFNRNCLNRQLDVQNGAPHKVTI